MSSASPGSEPIAKPDQIVLSGLPPKKKRSSRSSSLAKAFQTKNQRSKAIIKSTSSVTTFFESNALRGYLLTSTKKGKKDIIHYLSQERTTNEMVELITVKEPSMFSATYCHWATLTLLSIPQAEMRMFSKKHVLLLLTKFAERPLRSDVVLNDKTGVLPWYHFPNIPHYLAVAIIHYAKAMPGETLEIFRENLHLVPQLIENMSAFSDSSFSYFCTTLVKTEILYFTPAPIEIKPKLESSLSRRELKVKEKLQKKTPEKSPRKGGDSGSNDGTGSKRDSDEKEKAGTEFCFYKEFITQLLKKFSSNPEETISGISGFMRNALTDSAMPLVPKKLLASSLIKVHLTLIIQLMNNRETTQDATDVYLALLQLHSSPKLIALFFENSIKNAKYFQNMCGGSPFEGQNILEIIHFHISRGRLELFKLCLPPLVVAIFKFEKRNIFTTGTFALFKSIWTIPLEDPDLRTIMTTKSGIFPLINVYCLDNPKEGYLRHQLGEFLAALPAHVKPKEMVKAQKQLLEIPQLSAIFDLPPKLRAQKAARGSIALQADDLPPQFSTPLPSVSEAEEDSGEDTEVIFSDDAPKPVPHPIKIEISKPKRPKKEMAVSEPSNGTPPAGPPPVKGLSVSAKSRVRSFSR